MGELIGRLHPLIVHLPIGILLLAFLMELISRKEKYKYLRPSLPFILLVSIVFSILALFTGWILPKEGEYADHLVSLHFWLAISTTISSLLVYVFLITKKKKLYFPFFCLTILLLTLTGHFGGSLTHGEGYLTAPIDQDEKPLVTSVDSLYLYPDIIQPILKQKCYSCHNEGKQKGELIMTSIEDLMKGGEEGPIILEGNAGESPLLKRAHLPLEEKEHMPPKGKKQLTDNEIRLLEWWISTGPDFDKKVFGMEKPADIEVILKGYEQAENEINLKELEFIPEYKIEELKLSGMSIARQSENSPLLLVNLSRDTSLTSGRLKRLATIADNVYDLDLSFTNVDDKMLSVLKQFKNLQSLKLQNTKIKSTSLRYLEELKYLHNLNLYGTAVDDKGLESINKVKSLKSLYVWQSKISEKAIEKFIADHPKIHVQQGVDNSIFGDARLLPPVIIVEKPIFKDTARIEMVLNFKNVAVYYTLDGTDPDSSSIIYEGPFNIDQTAIVKAISYKPGWVTSEYAEKVVTKAGHKVAQAKLDKAPNSKYAAKGAQSLIDFNQGSLNFVDGSWLGYEGKHFSVSLDLGDIRSINNIIVGALENTPSYIFFPAEIRIKTSTDGKFFNDQLHLKIPVAKESNPATYKSFLLQMEKHEARYIEVAIFGTLKNPSWHAAPGAKSWVFIDEIMVN